MDSSPTTLSVNTNGAEKQRLAKASLAFNCKNPTFKMMFPEYVDKLNDQQQILSDQVSTDVSQEDVKTDIPIDGRQNRNRLFPTWLMILLVAIFGSIMALPLL